MPDVAAPPAGAPLPMVPASGGSFRWLCLRVAVTGAVLGAVLLRHQEQLLAPLLPAMELCIELLRPEFDVTLAWRDDPSGATIRMRTLAARSIDLGGRIMMPQHTALGTLVTTAHHALVPPLLFLTALLAWPARCWREWLVRLAAALPVLALLVACGAPLVLLGRADIACLRWAHRAGVALDATLTTDLMIFMEMGGGWLLPLAGAGACVALGARYANADPTRHTASLPEAGLLPAPAMIVFPPVAAPADPVAPLVRPSAGA